MWTVSMQHKSQDELPHLLSFLGFPNPDPEKCRELAAAWLRAVKDRWRVKDAMKDRERSWKCHLKRIKVRSGLVRCDFCWHPLSAFDFFDCDSFPPLVILLKGVRSCQFSAKNVSQKLRHWDSAKDECAGYETLERLDFLCLGRMQG